MYHGKNNYEVGDIWKVKDYFTKEKFLFLVLEVDIGIGVRVTRLDTDKNMTIYNGSRYDVVAKKVS